MCLCIGACVVKYILIFINLILTLVGLAITASGVVVLIQVRSIENAPTDDVNLIPTLIIVVGCVITVIFFLGCCGAITRNTCMLISYSVIILILASLTVGMTVFLSKNTTSVTDMATDQVAEMINGTDQTVLNSIESVLQCCGTTGPDSYSNTSLPLTCCPEALSNIQHIQQNIDLSSIGINVEAKELCSIDDAFTEGCLTKFSNTMKDTLNIVVNILICVCIGEYVAAGMATFLTCYIRRRK
ncbi:23 kDa integral membrane protein-like [Vanessa cardui]|uniref:23 kDa integral membrane protein-like n=1 Tax=Vanessa cardui TaxID=171605 RepID=UPI001F13B160|nr:23 kDa integral membrane protein-like [Vanessa cardui]